MEWSLTQNKLLAFHIQCVRISQLARYCCSGQHYGRCGWRHRAFLSSGSAVFVAGVWLMRALLDVW